MAENEKEIELSKLAQHVAMATLSHPFTQERFLILESIPLRFIQFLKRKRPGC